MAALVGVAAWVVVSSDSATDGVEAIVDDAAGAVTTRGSQDGAGGADDPGTPAAGGDAVTGGGADSTTVPPTTASTTTTEAPTTQVTAPPTGQYVYYNDFATGSLGPEWEQYDSVGNGGWGLRRPSALSVIEDAGATAGGRCLAITAAMGDGPLAGQMVSGGVKLTGHSLTYGRYTVRMRIDDDPSEVTSGVALLWPTSNLWPQDGEINIVENFYNRATRSPVESRLHWMKPDAEAPFDRADDALIQVDHAIDGSDWHTYVLEWRADSVTISVDGGPARSMSQSPALIPQWDMDLTLQLDGHDAPGTGTQPVIGAPVSMCVDYVRVERL